MFTPDTCPQDLPEALGRLSAAVTARETAALNCAGHRSWTPAEWSRNDIAELETAKLGGVLAADVRRLVDLVAGLAESAVCLQRALSALAPLAAFSLVNGVAAPDARAPSGASVAVPTEVLQAACGAHGAIAAALASAQASARQSREAGRVAGSPRPVGAIS